MSSESGIFHHLPCFNTDHLGVQSTPEGLPRLGVPPSSLQYPVARALPAPQRLVCYTLLPFCPQPCPRRGLIDYLTF